MAELKQYTVIGRWGTLTGREFVSATDVMEILSSKDYKTADIVYIIPGWVEVNAYAPKALE